MKLGDAVEISPGDVIGPGLRIVREIGRGGMGVVFEAQDPALGRRVAVKIISELGAADATARARFLREARAMATLKSPHALVVHAVGELPDGAPYVVTELLEGETVEAVVARGGPLPVATAVRWLSEALDALAEAHAHGLVHRDVKPANLFVTRAGVKLLDFGLVRHARGAGHSRDGRLTETGDALGTPHYMAPEQVIGSADVDPRADVWGAGVTLYEMLTARQPFDASMIPALLVAITAGKAVPVGERRADVPVKLQAVLTTCLARERAARYADAGALRAALLAALTPSPPSPSVVAPMAAAARRPSPSPDARATRASRSLLVGAVVLGAMVVIALVVGAAFALGRVRALEASAAPRDDASAAAPAASFAPLDDAAAPAPEASSAPVVSTAPHASASAPPPSRRASIPAPRANDGSGLRPALAPLRTGCVCLQLGRRAEMCPTTEPPVCHCFGLGSGRLCAVPQGVGGACPRFARESFERRDAACVGYVRGELDLYGRVSCSFCFGRDIAVYSGRQGEACAGFGWGDGQPYDGTLDCAVR